MDFDYVATNSPYPIITASSMNCGQCSGADTVQNRGYNVLVVGGSNDNGTPTTSDDVIYSDSSWRNWSTPHGDFELPNMVAPSVCVDSSSSSCGSGTSAAAPITLGAALLAIAENSTYATWPEMMRASVMATATHSVNGGRTTYLGAGIGDLKQGAGLLNSYWLVQLAASGYEHGPNQSASPWGHHAQYYNFTTDFQAGGGALSKDAYNIGIVGTGRLRVVMAWDSTATGCSLPNSNCTADTLDGDLDLQIYSSSGGLRCWSASYDSSWEICDLPVNAGETYSARFRRFATNATGTYVGIAWTNYNPSGE
jgi:hypothetical protein